MKCIDKDSTLIIGKKIYQTYYNIANKHRLKYAKEILDINTRYFRKYYMKFKSKIYLWAISKVVWYIDLE